jgi:hypothetical protein
MNKLFPGTLVKIISLPNLDGLEPEIQRLFQNCLGKNLFIDDLDWYQDGLEQKYNYQFNVKADGTQGSPCDDTIFLEPEHVERITNES